MKETIYRCDLCERKVNSGNDLNLIILPRMNKKIIYTNSLKICHSCLVEIAKTLDTHLMILKKRDD